MTYNVWVFIATIGGLGIGFFLCGWKMPKPSTGCKNIKRQQNGGIQEQEQTLLSEEIEMSRETVLWNIVTTLYIIPNHLKLCLMAWF